MKNEILEKCYQISPQAKAFVASSQPHEQTVFLNTDDELILSITLEDIVIMYAYSTIETSRFLFIIQDLVSRNYPFEWCFNVSQQAVKTRELLLAYNFSLDMAGYQMKRTTSIPSISNQLTYRLFQEDDYLPAKKLMKASYCPLLIPVSLFAVPLTYFDKDDDKQTLLFYDSNTLVGFTCLDKNYIRDFAIDPAYQNKGYGQEMLTHVLQYMSHYTPEAFLRVSENNTKAIHLYEKMGFTKISAFAEHTKKQTL
ncbi:MAG: GNAT family N-acetyltransferase [Bacilli bacterium]|jgi:ribosomal protein S18 acetylase RimI-like enzyme|nr:GNAT family N-acetyltransferase [Bacilli bacterium]MDY0063582.1 GNAT family N-acetyltransferase [Bacilli bacterium]